MKTVEIFCGTKSFSKVAKELGHDTYTVDFEPYFEADCQADLRGRIPEELDDKLKEADVIWMSPPCTTFSMASGNKHWTADRKPKTQAAIDGRNLLQLCENIGRWCIQEGKIFIIENPRARARWFLPKDWRKTVWYCQYGDNRAKPTDIWTNVPGWTGKMCKNGNPNCGHDRAPRGTKNGGTQAGSKRDRGKVPPALISELFRYIG